MKAADIPTKFNVRFASGAGPSFVRAVPETTADPVAASDTLGFPPDTFTPVGAGGTPLDGRDLNGILLQSTGWNQWQSAGGPIKYDAAFAAALLPTPGYPQGAIVASATSFGGFWLCTADDNTTDPDAGGAGWTTFPLPHAQVPFTAPGSVIWDVPAGVHQIFVECWGGGGGGGGPNAGATAPGPGGGGGGYSSGWFSVTPGQALTVSVGAGGTPGTVGGISGGDGGTSSVATMNVAGGGQGGQAGSGTPGTGGVGSGGSVNITGGVGGSFNATTPRGGNGGPSPRGGAGAPGVGSGTGNSGDNPGGGGSGAPIGQQAGTGGVGMVVISY